MTRRLTIRSAVDADDADMPEDSAGRRPAGNPMESWEQITKYRPFKTSPHQPDPIPCGLEKAAARSA